MKMAPTNQWMLELQIKFINLPKDYYILLEIRTQWKSFLLYEHQKEICRKFNIQVCSKETDLEYTNCIGYIIGVNYRLALMK